MAQRFILPNSADAVCEIVREGGKVEIKFFSPDGNAIGSKSFLMVSLEEEDIVNHLASTEVNFTTFSALYDAAELILTKIKESPEEDERKIILRRKQEEGLVEKEEEPAEEEVAVSEELKQMLDSGIQALNFETKDLGKLIHSFEASYTANINIYVFQKTRLAYSIIFEKDNKKVYQGDLNKIPDENDIYLLIQESKIPELESMSVMFDIAEIIVKACNSPDEHERTLPEQLKERVEISRDLNAYLQAKKTEQLKKGDVTDGTAQDGEKELIEGKIESSEASLSVSGELLLEFKVPYSESKVLFYSSSENEIIAVFYKEDKELSKKTISGIPSEDEAYDIVDASGITESFSSMSLIYDVTEKIIEVCTDPEKFRIVEEPEEEKTSLELTDSELEGTSIEPKTEPAEKEEQEEDETLVELRNIIETGTFVTELKIPYSHETSVKVYWNEKNNEFALRFWRADKEVDLKGTNSKLDEDGAWELFNGANIEFISMSVIDDAAQDIISIVQDPESYIKVEKAVDIDDDSFTGFERDEEEDLPVDFDQFTGPEHIEPLLQEIKKILAKSNKPVQVMEQTIKPMPKVGFKVFRQGEIWSLDFFSVKDGKILSQRPAKLKTINADEVFKAVNNGIPQVTLTEVSDAADYIYEIIKHLAQRPADDLAFSQVVNHFEKVIDQYESQNEISKATELIQGLMEKLERLGNAGGVAKFGLKLAKILENQDKITDSSKLRLELIPRLSKLKDLQTLREFVDDTIELFSAKANRPLDAAQVSVDFAEIIIRNKDLILGMKYVKEASQYFKQENILRAQADHNFRFAKLYLQILRGDEPEGFFIEPEDETEIELDASASNLVEKGDDPFVDLGDDPFADLGEQESENVDTEEIIAVKDKTEALNLPNPLDLFELKEKSLDFLLKSTEELFKGTLNILFESKEENEHLETLTEIILLYRRYQFLREEIVFGEIGVTALQDYGQQDRALKLSLQLMNKLVVKDGDIPKGLEFFNKAIKLIYEKNELRIALDLTMEIIPKLILYAEKEVALQYCTFGQDMVDRVFPKPTEDSLVYYLDLSKHFLALHKQDQSLSILSKAIEFKKSNVDELLEFCHNYSTQYFEQKDWNTARDFINSSLNVIGGTDYQTIFKVAFQFFKDLSSHGNFTMANEYLTYAYQLTGQLADPLESAGHLVIESIQHYLAIEEADVKENINPLLPILKAYISKTQKFGDIQAILEPVIDKFMANEYYDEVVENVRDLSIYLQYAKDFVTAGKVLRKARDELINKTSLETIREFTDKALKLSVDDTPEGQNRGIEILDSAIPYFVENEEYSDAYLYSVQVAKYFESQKRTKDAINFIKEKRSIFENKNRDQDVNSLTDLMVRLAKSISLEEAADISYNAYLSNLEKQNWEASYAYLTEAANTYVKLDQNEKANQILDEGYDVFLIHKEAHEEAMELIYEIIKFRKVVNKWKEENILDFYKQSLKISLEHANVKLSNKLILKQISLVKANFPDKFYDEVSEAISILLKGGFYKESHPYVSDLLLNYVHDPSFARELLFYYVKEYIKANEVEIAQRLVEVALERSKSDSGNIIRITMRFVQILAGYRLSGQARSYIDKIVANLFPTTMMDITQTTAVATIYDKFATMVIKGSPELAIEYGYKAADLYRKVKNYDKFIAVYTVLSNQIEEEESVRSILRRGTNQAERLRIPFKKQLPLQTKLVYSSFETKAPSAEREFQQVLAQLEKENLLEETFDFLQEVFFKMVRIGEFDLFYKYIDYLKTLAEGIGAKTTGQKILIQLAARYFNKRKDKKKVKKLKQIYDSLTHEENPSDELLAYFLKTGGIELPEKPILVEETPITEPKTAESISLMSEENDSDEMKEVEASASSLEDELLEIGGDELSQALANAISQLTSDIDLNAESDINFGIDSEEEDKATSKILAKELTPSTLDSKDVTQEKSDEPALEMEEVKSLEVIFSSALNDLTSAFGVPDLESNSSESSELIGNGSLSAEEEQIYLEINKEYAKTMKGKDFYSAIDNWKAKLPSLLSHYNISEEQWNILSEKGDSDEKLSAHLAEITK